MDFRKYLEVTTRELDQEVRKILEKELKKADKTDKKLIPFLKAFIKSCQGGKIIRGTLVILGYQLAAHLPGVSLGFARDRQAHLEGEIIKIGAAVEIVHTAILVHDDIIDKSLTRREQASLYAALGGDHYGVSQAISLADYGFFLSYKIICETDFPNEFKIKALSLFSQVMMNTGWGEILDLEDTDPLTVMKLKTACYTIAGPLQMGAILAGAEKKLIDRLGEFGENLGIAYQIQDDILDSEIRSVERGKREVVKFTNKAMKVLPMITGGSNRAKDKTMSKLLEQLAEYLVNRKK